MGGVGCNARLQAYLANVAAGFVAVEMGSPGQAHVSVEGSRCVAKD